MCQEATYALQQRAPGLNHLVGGGEQPGGNFEFEGSGGLYIDDQLEFGRPVDNASSAGFAPLRMRPA